MNHPMVLLYNLNNKKGGKIRRMCLPLGLRTRLVEPAEYGLTLSQLVETTHGNEKRYRKLRTASEKLLKRLDELEGLDE